MLAKPSVARFKFTFSSTEESPLFKVCSTDSCEVVSVIVTGGSSACIFRILDAAQFPSGGYSQEDGFAVGARSSDSTPYTPAQPVPMRKGCIIVVEQGDGTGAECMVTLN